MSQGAFQNAKYQDSKDPGNIRSIKIQPETLTLTVDGVANTQPSGALNSYPRATVSAGRRSNGVNARLVSFKFTGTVPAGYKAGASLTLPWLTATTFGDVSEGMAGTYAPLGTAVAIEVTGVSPERVK
jgi:hypothetical protein